MELGGHQFSEQLVPSLFPDEPRPALLLRGQEPVDILRFTHDNASQLAALQVNHPVIAVYPIQLPAWGKMDPRELNVATSWHRDLAAGSSQSPWTSTILVNDSGGNLRNRTEWRSNLAFLRLLEANAAVLSDLIQQETTGIDRASLTDDLSCALDTTKSEEDRSAAAHFLFLGLIYQRKACFNDFLAAYQNTQGSHVIPWSELGSAAGFIDNRRGFHRGLPSSSGDPLYRFALIGSGSRVTTNFSRATELTPSVV
jgi:hypothetical protein